jgi:peptidoglycan hydrolase-like protein with peptidoglycan-binding domain
MTRNLIPTIALIATMLPSLAAADELTQIVQQDLASLKYTIDNLDGDMTPLTIVAVSKFQAEHQLEVTGEITAQLAGIIKAAISQQEQGTVVSTSVSAASDAAVATEAAVPDEAALRAAQQACLQKKVAEAQEAQQKRSRFSRLTRAVSRTASRLGGDSISNDIAEISNDIYVTGEVVGDLDVIAEELGVTETDIEACRNP